MQEVGNQNVESGEQEGVAVGVIKLEGTVYEAPQAVVTVIPDELPPVVVGASDEQRNALVQDLTDHMRDADSLPHLSADDAAELQRLELNLQAQPTNFRAQQELLSFKRLKGIE